MILGSMSPFVDWIEYRVMKKILKIVKKILVKAKATFIDQIIYAIGLLLVKSFFVEK